MLSLAQRRRIERACVTVKLRQVTGRGCLIPGPFILTAAHTITYALDGRECVGLSMGDHCVVELTTTHGPLQACPVALEHLSDCAVLGALDNQVFFEQAKAFDAWCLETAPVPLCFDALPTDQPTWIAMYTHLGAWIEGTAHSGVPGASGGKFTVAAMAIK